MTADDGERLLTTSDAAAVLGVDDTTVTRWARTGKLTSVVTPGGHRRFRPGDLERLTGDRGRTKGLGRARPVRTAPKRRMNRRLLGSTQVAAMLDVDRKAVIRWSDRGLLPVAETTASGHRRWRPEDVQRFAAEHAWGPEAGS